MVKTVDKLIIVPGHAPFKDSVDSVPDDFREDAHWVLQDFQEGEPSYYVEHIQTGLDLVKQDSASLLMFSGGRTRRESQKWSEATTYKAIASKINPDINLDTELEEFARDSFENLEFSLYQFYIKVGRYPTRITVAGWKFKQDRFQLHADTLGISSDRFNYVGVNNPENLEGALRGEKKALADFRSDPFGSGAALRAKRLERNPFKDVHQYTDLPPIVIA